MSRAKPPSNNTRNSPPDDILRCRYRCLAQQIYYFRHPLVKFFEQKISWSAPLFFVDGSIAFCGRLHCFRWSAPSCAVDGSVKRDGRLHQTQRWASSHTTVGSAIQFHNDCTMIALWTHNGHCRKYTMVIVKTIVGTSKKPCLNKDCIFRENTTNYNKIIVILQ